MSYTNASVRLPGVCLLPIAAMAQASASVAVPAGEVGVHYGHNSLAASNQNGASVYGEYFFKRSVPHLQGQNRLSLIADVNAAGANVSFTHNGIAVGIVGVGLDLRMGPHYVLTLLQSDFPATGVPDLPSGAAHWQGDLRVSAGIGFRFGEIR